MRGANIETEALRLRLESCLQTILEFKGNLGSVPFGTSFLPELGSLEEFLSRLDSIELNEYEVRRIEKATGKFLSELGALMERNNPKTGGKARRLQ